MAQGPAAAAVEGTGMKTFVVVMEKALRVRVRAESETEAVREAFRRDAEGEFLVSWIEGEALAGSLGEEMGDEIEDD
jgi:hypothetical protein